MVKRCLHCEYARGRVDPYAFLRKKKKKYAIFTVNSNTVIDIANVKVNIGIISILYKSSSYTFFFTIPKFLYFFLPYLRSPTRLSSSYRLHQIPFIHIKQKIITIVITIQTFQSKIWREERKILECTKFLHSNMLYLLASPEAATAKECVRKSPVFPSS